MTTLCSCTKPFTHSSELNNDEKDFIEGLCVLHFSAIHVVYFTFVQKDVF